LTGPRAVRIIPGMSVFEVLSTVFALAAVVGVIVVLPVVALWRARLHAPRDRDPAFVQHSEHPMPDKSYHGQGRGGM
jgi:hypothetical protein